MKELLLQLKDSQNELKNSMEKAIDRLENNQKSMKNDITGLKNDFAVFKFTLLALILLILTGTPDIKNIASNLLKLLK